MSGHVEALGWTLLHSLWQGAGLWLLLEAVLAWPRLVSPRVRGRLAGGALAIFVLLAAGTYGWLAREGRGPAGSLRTKPAARSAAAPAGGTDPRQGGVETTRAGGAPIAEPAATGTVAGGGSAPAWRERMRPALPWLVGAWLAGVALKLARHGREWRFLHRLARASLVTLPPEWVERFAALWTRCAPGREAPRIGETWLVGVPLVVGGLAPAILLPAGFLAGLSPAQVEAVLAHEIAHLVRRDFWLNALQCLAEAVFFFHPAVYAFNARIRRERERACDDFAVAQTGDALGYVRALATLAGAGGGGPSAALAADGHEPGDLLARIRRLLGRPDPSRRERVAQGRALGLLLPVAALLAYAGLFAVSPAIVARVLPPEERIARVAEAVTASRAPHGDSGQASPLYPESRIRLISELRTEDGSPPPEFVRGSVSTRNGPTGSGCPIQWNKGKSVKNEVAAGVVSVLALPEDWAPAVLFGVKPDVGASEVSLPPLTLRKGMPLRVRLSTPEGTPLADVQVKTWVRPREFRGFEQLHLADRRSDADGVVTLPHADADFVYTLTAESAGRQNTQREVTGFTPGMPIEWVLPASRAITGRVADRMSGEPLAGVEVFLRGTANTTSVQLGGPADPALTRTDADGRFTLPGWDDTGIYALVFRHRGHASSVVAARAGETLDIRLAPGGHRVSGRLRLSPGAPDWALQAGLGIGRWVAMEPKSSHEIWLAECAPKKEADGYSFAFENLPDGPMTLTMVSVTSEARLDLRGDRDDLELTLDEQGLRLTRPAAAVAGRAVAPPSRAPEPAKWTGPVRTVEWVVILPDGGPGLTGKLGMLITPPENPAGAGMVYHPLFLKDGRAELADVPVGAHVSGVGVGLSEVFTGYRLPEADFTVPAGEGVYRYEIHALAAGAVTVTILDEQGLPMRCDKLFLEGCDEPGGPARLEPLLNFPDPEATDRRRTFPSVPLGGTYRVVATNGGRVAMSGPITLSGAAPVAEVSVHFAPAEAAALRVLRPDGTPAEQIDVVLGYCPKAPASAPSLEGYRTDGEGRVRLPAVTRDDAVAYQVDAVPTRDWRPVRGIFTGAAPGPWTLTLAPGLRAEGRVSNREGGPVQDVMVIAYADQPEAESASQLPAVEAEAQTDTEGRFRFSNLPPGRLRFVPRGRVAARGSSFPILDLPAVRHEELRIVVE